jgi:hypothetical protein
VHEVPGKYSNAHCLIQRCVLAERQGSVTGVQVGNVAPLVNQSWRRNIFGSPSCL